MKKQTVKARITEIDEKTWAVHNPMLNRVNGGTMSSGNTTYCVSFETENQDIRTFVISGREADMYTVGQAGELTYRDQHFIRFTNSGEEDSENDPVRKTAFRVIAGVAALLVLAALVFLARTLILRSEYKRMAEKAEASLEAAETENVTVSHNGITYTDAKKLAAYYVEYLLNEKTVVQNRQMADGLNDPIVITTGTDTLAFEKATEFGEGVCVHWQTGDNDRYYTVNSDRDFSDLEERWNQYVLEMQRREALNKK